MCKKITLSVLVISALVGMTGCGGGSTPNEVDAGIASTKISGVAVDDLIFNGLVTAKKADGTELATGRTSESDGTYTLNVEHDGVMLLNVTCDENSTMGLTPSDAGGCADQGISLNSLADVEPGVAQTVNISPLSEIVYQRAEEQAGGDISTITATEFDDAIKEVGLLFTVDPLSDPTTGTVADIIATIHTLADDTNSSVIEITNLLAAEFSDGSADGTDDATVFALTEVMSDANITNNLTVSDGTYTPPEEPAALSDIDAAKALFTELRTQAMSVVDYDNSGTPGFLDTEAQSMDNAMNGVVLNVGVMGEYLNFIANDISYMLDNNLTDFSIYTQTSPGNWRYSAKDENGIEKWSGTVSIPEVLLGNDAEAELYTPGALTMTVDGTLPLDYTPVTEAGIIDSQSFNGTIAVTKTETGADISITGKVASNGTSIELKAADAEIAYVEGEADPIEGNTEPVFNYFKLNQVELQGVVGVYTIDGSVAVNSYVQNNGLKDKGGIEEIATTYFGAQAYCSDNITSYSNALIQATFDGVTYDVYTDTNGYFHGELAGAYDMSDFENAYSTIVFDETVCPTGTYAQAYIQYIDSWSEEEIANSGWLPNDITFSGAISRTGAAMSGTLHAKWLNADTMDVDSNETPLVNVTFNGKLQIPDRPEMLATLTFENNATNNTLSASYTYDTTVINMSALFDSEMDNGDVEITTHTGLRADLKITDGSLVTDGTSTVTKSNDGSLVGTLENREDVPVIKYIDGSFESLP